tara:strand:- start:551 stop:721 length:171 start_codon:yes stop_codon:yes gene_type:complete
MINDKFIKLQRRSGLNNQEVGILTDMPLDTVRSWRSGPASKHAIDRLNQYIKSIGA